MKRIFQNFLADARNAMGATGATRAIAIVAIMLAFTAQAHAASSIADQLQQSVNPYVNMGIRVFGAMIGIGGLVVGFKGLTGREEGFDKVFMIGTGLIGIGLGALCIGKTGVIIGWLNLANAFSTGS